jgi:hypothetical protein
MKQRNFLLLITLVGISILVLSACGGSKHSSSSSSSSSSSNQRGSKSEAEMVAQASIYGDDDQEFVAVKSFSVNQIVNTKKMYVGMMQVKLGNGQTATVNFAGWYPSEP